MVVLELEQLFLPYLLQPLHPLQPLPFQAAGFLLVLLLCAREQPFLIFELEEDRFICPLVLFDLPECFFHIILVRNDNGLVVLRLILIKVTGQLSQLTLQLFDLAVVLLLDPLVPLLPPHQVSIQSFVLLLQELLLDEDFLNASIRFLKL